MRGRRERLREEKQGERSREWGGAWVPDRQRNMSQVWSHVSTIPACQETEAEGLQDLMTEASLACIVRPLCPPGPQKRLS